MSIFNPEYVFTCEKCGASWYLTKKEIKECRTNRRMYFSMKSSRIGSLNTKKIHNLTSKMGIIQNQKDLDKKCPNCGSHHITKEKA